ncbi:VUT family protein [Hydromonas duriensis]|uniref:Queuosine precursor transporter n=1 Tax=Hydromonas duriensis TaxID=1527608 RepID=A0A4R6Y589_9BURK|nr:VUT family protein [Hydromonas duriensis]TDR30520.1 hypothetical protein DFR44_12030 [Hydromonas duriensis]
MINLFSVLYLLTVVFANLAFAFFMQGDDMHQLLIIDGVICFFMIGFDMAIRDKLHDAWEHTGLFWKMPTLILLGSVISFLINRNAGQVALASFAAFASAGMVDFLVYHVLREHSHWQRVNGSNILSAAVDSLVFPLIAFGLPMQWLFFSVEFLTKVLGGVVCFFAITLFLRNKLQAQSKS